MPYGIITNCIAVFLGGVLGAFLKNHFPQKLKEALPNIFGLSAITMGISLIIMLKSLSAVVLALIVGTVIGELLNLEDNLLKGLHRLEERLPLTLDDEQMDVLISMIILFCFSGTGVFGAMNSAMTGDHSILYAKAIMDFFTAIIFGTTAGYLVGFIAVPQFAVGILLFGGASYILPLVTDTMLANFKACGGIITLAVGLKISGIKRTKVLNILPAIASFSLCPACFKKYGKNQQMRCCYNNIHFPFSIVYFHHNNNLLFCNKEDKGMIRRIIKINEDLCNGCGACAAACHEGAIGMVDGKARLLKDDYCDGLGDCLPTCYRGHYL